MTAAKKVLTAAQRELLAQVLDRIVPAGGGLPGAGEARVAEFVESAVCSAPRQNHHSPESARHSGESIRHSREGGNPSPTRLLVDGLKQIEMAAARHASGTFADLDAEAQDEVLRAVESESPRFFDELVRLTYVGYYSQPRIAAALGLEARPPQPLGFDMQQGDLSLVENVRNRGPVYREA